MVDASNAEDWRDPVSVEAERDAADVGAELTSSFLGDPAVAEIAHVALGFAVTMLLIGIYPAVPLVSWFSSLAVASLVRYRVRRRYAAQTPPPDRVPCPVLISIVTVGAVWAAGATPLVTSDLDMMHHVMIVEAGLAAAATATFAASVLAFRVFLASIFLPLIAAILAQGLSRESITSALLVVVFAGVMTAIQKRGNDQLARSVRLHWDLDRSRRVAEARSVAVRENEQRLFQFLESMPVGVIVIEKSGTVYFSNAAAQQLGGPHLRKNPTVEELRNAQPAYVPGTQQPYPRERSPVTRALAGEAAVEHVEILGPTGLRLVEIHGSPIRTARVKSSSRSRCYPTCRAVRMPISGVWH